MEIPGAEVDRAMNEGGFTQAILELHQRSEQIIERQRNEAEHRKEVLENNRVAARVVSWADSHMGQTNRGQSRTLFVEGAGADRLVCALHLPYALDVSRMCLMIRRGLTEREDGLSYAEGVLGWQVPGAEVRAAPTPETILEFTATRLFDYLRAPRDETGLYLADHQPVSLGSPEHVLITTAVPVFVDLGRQKA